MSQDLWKSDENWFVDWFNCEAYHALYKHRDINEASEFINRFSEQLLKTNGMRLLDLGCGKGRHSVSLASKGHKVVGVDLSDRSISFANEAYGDSKSLSFVQADMRHLDQHFSANSFDGVLLLFTSFGYFEDDADHASVLTQIRNCLRPGGIFLLDHFNLDTVRDHLTSHEFIRRDDWVFEINRRIHKGWVEKSIRYKTRSGTNRHVVERVRAFEPQDLNDMCKSAGFLNLSAFGNYNLDALSGQSPRCILVARK
jgi:SAM-dependent methyltransferase